MSYLVLARKYRPQSFDSVVGQTHITQALANAIVRDKVPHALLFTGPRGVGKTTSARLLARALNCTGRELPSEQEAAQDDNLLRQAIEPCGTCQNCIEIARSSSLAVWEIDGASNNSVDNVRELIDSLRTSAPPHARYKIYIIDEVHMLSTSAFNALLKSLEEPPPHTVFIFATTEPHKIPETVLSRCQRYDFRGLAIESIVEQLRSIVTAEKLDVGDDVLEFIARRSQGGMRDSQSMLDRIISYAGDTITIERAQEVFGAVGIEFFSEYCPGDSFGISGACF
jgi:DNA polymerase-3 subunit gamma/tau